ncbi:hypothetical protein M2101_000994 [Parabacteroides sp. PM5-20]|nr:hypothetical protein [Parabacteroides sp. PM5-20]
MRNLVLTCMLFLTTVFSLSAQNIQIKGVVVSSADNEPLLGVNVVVKGTTNGTMTDLDGQFTLSAPDQSILTISYIGFKPLVINSNRIR